MRQSSQEEIKQFGKIIVEWSRENPRSLPWKSFSDPYSIWIAEIILQQTRVDQGSPYFKNFIREFPDLNTLANASIEEVLKAWEGLGYYSRARHLHHTAQFVWNELEGRFPDNSSDLQRLKGIGPYTGAAIASFAFGERIGVVDGNVKRVVSRFFNITEDVNSSATKHHIQSLVNQVVSHYPSAEFNQAIMNFGALVCIPTKPDCDICPANENCLAYHHNTVSLLPVKKKAQPKKTRWLYFGVYVQDDHIALIQNTDSNIWRNLFHFPLVGSKNDFKSSVESTEVPTIPHYHLLEEMEWVLSHRRLNIRFYRVDEWPVYWSKKNSIQLVEVGKLSNFALPRPLRLFLIHNSRKLGIKSSHDQ